MSVLDDEEKKLDEIPYTVYDVDNRLKLLDERLKRLEIEFNNYKTNSEVIINQVKIQLDNLEMFKRELLRYIENK